MAIPGITYRLEKGTSLTHQEMDDNFRSLIYSSSLHDSGATLRLHFDTSAGDFFTIPLNSNTGSFTITDNIDNRVVTATGTTGLAQGEANLTFDGSILTVSGKADINLGTNNTIIGSSAGTAITTEQDNTAIGFRASRLIQGNFNTTVGASSLANNVSGNANTVVGRLSLSNNTNGSNNVSLGESTGINVTSGNNNVYLGYNAGPSSSTTESNKLYINNTSGSALIQGDFSTGQVTINSQVSASLFSGSFVGDGSGLTGVSVTTEWDGSLNGNAEITGSLIISGTNVNIDFTNTQAISGSIFSGSFVGDGSGITGIVATAFPYTGSAQITGSLAVTGSLNVTGPGINLSSPTIIDTNIKIHNPNVNTPTNTGIGFQSLENLGTSVVDRCNTAIGYCAGAGTPILASTDGNISIGAFAQQTALGSCNIAIGLRAACKAGGVENIAIGAYSMHNAEGLTTNTNIGVGNFTLSEVEIGTNNTSIGHTSLLCLQFGNGNTAIGRSALCNLTNTCIGVLSNPSNNNTALGFNAGRSSRCSTGNIYIGANSGPVSLTNENNKLYINNASGNPLIGGDFSLKTVTISGSLIVSQSVTAGQYFGDGSNLTGVEWDGTHNGNAQITGSLIVSGSNVSIDFTNTLAISGSIFSGSFTGDGSTLTGVVSEWDGSRDGNASITGSLIVSGALDVSDTITIGSTGYPGAPGVELIHLHSGSLSGTVNLTSFSINSTTGYTGFKADYTLSNSTEGEKKVGTLLGGWDQVGNSTINDAHTIPSGNIINTAFSIDASDTNNAILKLDASIGSYDLNMLITAFKRQV